MFKGAWGVSLTFESLVAIRSRVLQRLEMGVDGDGGEALCDAALDLLQQFVTLLHCPDARNQYVERCKSPSARAPRPHRVKADSASAKFVEHMLEDFALLRWPRGIHQTQDRTPQQLPTNENDVAGYCQGDQWVEHEPAGEDDQRHTQDYPC